MTNRELQDAESAYWDAVKHAEEMRQQRNEAIRRALAEGWTHAQIASATGLSRGRIGQLKL